MGKLILNPPAPQLWGVNAVVSGSHWRYEVPTTQGTLSVKSVRHGKAVWRTGDAEYWVGEDSLLILNDGQTYSLEIDAPRQVETFCVFLKPGYIEQAAASLRSLDLDPSSTPVGFVERMAPKSGRTAAALERFHGFIGKEIDDLRADEMYLSLAIALLEDHHEHRRERLRIDAAKAGVREEIHRRISRARDYMLSNLSEPLKLADIAREACLSEFHFHRLFTAVFQETPHAFLLSQRLQKAQRLLKSSRYEVQEIAWLCGYENASSFCYRFQKEVGLSPGAFRRAG